jgi:hypothetical protein
MKGEIDEDFNATFVCFSEVLRDFADRRFAYRWAVSAVAATPSVPNPVVTGPIPANAPPGDPSHDYPQLATSLGPGEAAGSGEPRLRRDTIVPVASVGVLYTLAVPEKKYSSSRSGDKNFRNFPKCGKIRLLKW